MTIESNLKQQIARECMARQAVSGLELPGWIESGNVQAAVEKLVFFTSPTEFADQIKQVTQAAKKRFGTATPNVRLYYLRFLTDLYLSLSSSLPRWNLQNTARYSGSGLDAVDLKKATNQVRKAAEELGSTAPAETHLLLTLWKKETIARLKAEAAMDPQNEADRLIGCSINEYLDHVIAMLESSNVRRMTEMQFAGLTTTEFSNDYAMFLPYALLLGASFVTCNPVLVDGAWAADPEQWDSVADNLIADNEQMDDDRIAQLMTMQVVLSNMLLLRPIFLLTEGRMGCVCLQVNPHKHGDTAGMTAGALFLFEKLQAQLSGRVPNVVFKLPGTKAGLETARVLTERGIGVTITVNFGMFQHLPFAQVLKQGHALFSSLVEMNGRLAFPVRDELLTRLNDLAAYGINERQAREAAAWSGVAVVKRLYRLLKERGYDLTRTKILIASLRVYDGEAYAGLPSAIPDITETIGSGIMSIFPDIRRIFDMRSGLPLDPRSIESPVPAKVMAILAHSEIFKQAYYVNDREWIDEDDARFRPAAILRLDDVDKTAAWTPVNNTLSQFSKSYDSLVQRVQARRAQRRRSG